MLRVTDYATEQTRKTVAGWRRLARQYRANIGKYAGQDEYWQNCADFARDVAAQFRSTGDFEATRQYFAHKAEQDVPGFSTYLYAVRECERLAHDIATYRYYVTNGWDVSTRPLA